MSASGVSVDPEKVEAVMSWERLKSVDSCHSRCTGINNIYILGFLLP